MFPGSQVLQVLPRPARLAREAEEFGTGLEAKVAQEEDRIVNAHATAQEALADAETAREILETAIKNGEALLVDGLGGIGGEKVEPTPTPPQEEKESSLSSAAAPLTQATPSPSQLAHGFSELRFFVFFL